MSKNKALAGVVDIPITPELLKEAGNIVKQTTDSYMPVLKIMGKVVLVGVVAGTGFVAFKVVSSSLNKGKVEKLALSGNGEAEAALALASIFDKPGLLAWISNFTRGAEEVIKDITLLSVFLPKDEKRNTPYEKARYIAAQIRSKQLTTADISKYYQKYTGNLLSDDVKKNLKPKERDEFYGIIQGTVDYSIEDAKSETDLPTPEAVGESSFSAAAKGEFVCMKKNAAVFGDILWNKPFYLAASTMNVKQFSAQDLLPQAARIAASLNFADEIKKGVPLGIFTGVIKKYDSWGTSNPDMLQIKRGNNYFWVEAENALRFKSKELAQNFVKGSYPNAEADMKALNGLSPFFDLQTFGLD